MPNVHTETSLATLRRKFATLCRDPVGVPVRILKSKIEHSQYYPTLFRLYRKSKQSVKSLAPVYNVCDWYLNRSARKAYEHETVFARLSTRERMIVNEVEEHGIFVVHFDDLFPEKSLKELQES